LQNRANKPRKRQNRFVFRAIADALLQRLNVCGISICEWFDSLRGKVKDEANVFLKEIFQSKFSSSFSISD